MGKKLAIRGHSTRGNEVIELLEIMGGKNTLIVSGYEPFTLYYINNKGTINYKHHSLNKAMIVFTLEEFWEKYPFKIGELKDLLDNSLSCVISEMRWNAQAECVEYHATFGLNDYGWHKVSDFCRYYQIEEPNTVISGINLNSCDYADKVELNLGDYEIEIRDGKTYAVRKKPKYPKLTNLTECKEILGEKDIYQSISGYKGELLTNFQLLLIFRDAYWKIAGEQMGLDKPWEPDWISGKPFYCISVSGNIIGKGKWYTDNKILAFPTEEMRDVFYENFKDLIEQCKELL